MTDLVQLAARGCGVIRALYDAADTAEAYRAVPVKGFGFEARDVILADELGYRDVPVGLLLEDLETEEIFEIYRGTRVVLNGPNEWLVDADVVLNPCPFAPGCRTHKGFTDAEETFHLLSGGRFPAVQRIVGHSLAAAWATLRGAKYGAKVIALASPRVGDQAFSDHAAQAIPELVRVVEELDVVPRWPRDVWPFFEYVHVGPAIEFAAGSGINPDLDAADRIEAWHNIDTYWNAMDPSHPVAARFAARSLSAGSLV